MPLVTGPFHTWQPPILPRLMPSLCPGTCRPSLTPAPGSRRYPIPSSSYDRSSPQSWARDIRRRRRLTAAQPASKAVATHRRSALEALLSAVGMRTCAVTLHLARSGPARRSCRASKGSRAPEAPVLVNNSRAVLVGAVNHTPLSH